MQQDEPYNLSLEESDRAFHYGDGLFETMLKRDDDIALWNLHYERLKQGCQRLSIVLPDKAWLSHYIRKKSRDMPAAVIKLIVSRGQGGRGLKLPEQDKASIFVLCYPYAGISNSGFNNPIAVAMCKTRLPINPNLAGLKHLNRLDYVLASIELTQQTKKDEGILCDTDGYLVEGLISNLFFFKDQKAFTPSLDLTGVNGIMRGMVIKQLKSMDINLDIGSFKPEMILQADECFMCNSVRGISPISSIDTHEFASGRITHSLQIELNRNNLNPNLNHD